MSDEDLFRAYKNGNVDAFGEIMNKYKGPIYNYIVRMTGRRAADDIFQEVFIKVLEKASSYTSKGKFSHWLFSIARNAALDWHRKNKGREVSLDSKEEGQFSYSEKLADKKDSPEEVMEKNEISRTIEAALGKLSYEQKEIFCLRCYSGLNFREISEILNIPIGTALARMSRGMEKMRKEMEGFL